MDNKGVARTIVLDALRAGKSVVTANKALMAAHGQEVMEAAADAGTVFLRESALEKVLAGETTLREINRVTFVD